MVPPENFENMPKQMARLLLALVLFSALAGLVVSDAGGFFRNGNGGKQDVATVGGKGITAQEFMPIYRRALMQNNIEEKQALQMGLPYMVLQQEITRRTMTEAAHAAGIRLGTQRIANELRKQLDATPLSGTTKEKLQVVLRQQDMSEAQFVAMLRDSFTANLLASSIAGEDMQIPSAMIEAPFRAERQQRSAEAVTISRDAVRNNVKVSDKDIADFYKEKREAYRTMEKRDLAILTLPQKLFLGDTKIDDAAIKKFYDENTDQFMLPARVKMAQMIASDEKAAKAMLDKKPADIAAVKEKDVQAMTSDWYTQPSLPQELQNALYPAKPSGWVGPVKTSLGWHVLKVESYEESKPRPLADANETIHKQLNDEALDAQLNKAAESIESHLGDESVLDDLAKEYKLEQVVMHDVTATALPGTLKEKKLPEAMAQRISEAAAQLQEGETSPLLTTPDGDMMLVQVKKITPSSIPALEAIHTQVEQNARQAAENRAMQALADRLINATSDKNKTAFADAARKNNLAVKNVGPMNFATAEKEMGKGAANLLFALSTKSPVSSTEEANSITVLHLQQIVPFTGPVDEKALPGLRDKAKSSLSMEIQQEFLQGWRDQLKAEPNMKLMQQIFAQETTTP